MNELRDLLNNEKRLKALHELTKDMDDNTINDISLFYCEDDVSPEEFKKIIKKIRIKFQTQNI